MKAMIIGQIILGYDCSMSVVSVLDTLPMAETKEGLNATFIELDLILDVAKLTLLGPTNFQE